MQENTSKKNTRKARLYLDLAEIEQQSEAL